MLQRLPIAFAQVKADNTEITKWNMSNQIFFVLSKKITKKVYNKTMNLVKL